MAQTLAKGGNTALPTASLIVRAKHTGAQTDLSAILLTATGKVRSEEDFVFYGQPESPEGSVKCQDKKDEAGFTAHGLSVILAKVPEAIERIVITLTIDPDSTEKFNAVKDLSFSISDEAGNELVSFAPQGDKENAFIVGELYRRQGAWKVRHVAQGFENGLGAIATQYGIDIKDDSESTAGATTLKSNSTATSAPAQIPASPAPAPAPKKVSLSKIDKVTAELEKSGSRLISLQKSAAVSLKKNNLDNIIARVIMVLDASGSTSRMWPAIMQAVTDRLATLALNLDDNGELEFYVYATGYRKTATVKLSNLDQYIAAIQRGEDGSGELPTVTVTSTPAPEQKKGGLFGGIFGGGSTPAQKATNSKVLYTGSGIIPGIGYDNNEPPIMQAILDDCKGNKTVPTLVLFVTDGGIDKDRAIEKVLRDASHEAIFWQFIGLGGSSYGILERFDELDGRHVDNASFFAIDDYRSISDAELFERVTKEFPQWLTKVRALGMLL